MFSSANRAESYFDDPNQFDPWRNIRKSMPFGVDPHLRAGARAPHLLIVNVAFPMILRALPNMTLGGSVEFKG